MKKAVCIALSALGFLCVAGCSKSPDNVPKDEGTEHVHKYKRTVTRPTWTSAGKYDFVCACGDSYSSDYVYDLGNSSDISQATCGEERTVFFSLSNVHYVDSNMKVCTEYYRVAGVCLYVSKTENEVSPVNLKLSRGASTAASAYSYNAKITFNDYGKWIAPFDLSVSLPQNLNVTTYRYYKITVDKDVVIDEIVFVGEVLEDVNGEGTGVYKVIPAEIFSPEEHLRLDGLLDAQIVPFIARD